MSDSAPALTVDRRVDALGALRILPDETICAILELLSPTDLGRLSCVSSVMYIFCNEEPLWMNKCLSIGGSIDYKGSWKKTALSRDNLCKDTAETFHKPLTFDGFFSLFLYKRWYRCHTSLSSFSLDNGYLERKEDLSQDEFSLNYDGKKPIMITGLAETWPARKKWTIEQLVEIYGDTIFRISQKSSKKVTMKFKDYVSYMHVQHDEDPLYIFDDKFGERAPPLLEDYEVPHLFKDDFFDLLGHDQRPPFRWLIIGPERSGASWHVDPGLTSAWNTLLCGRKRWALYPPGRVPAGVTVHVNEEDGDVNIESPTSVQWWLDIYPHLSDEDKPIECTQFPGETIYVPSGWWHCVLNLETTIAVTQNYVNKSNFEFVCLDLAPGHCHKGVSRAGFLALSGHDIENVLNSDRLNHPEVTRKGDILKSPTEIYDGTINQVFSYDIEFLSQFLEEERNHYCSAWSPNIYIGQREMREWLCKLWVAKPDIRELIWKGACLAVNVEKWYNCLLEICSNHKLPAPLDDEKLPVGTGSNPVFVISDNIVKIYAEGGFECALHGLGTELEFYNLLQKYDSPLREHVPEIVASGFLVLENGSHKTIPWDGRGVPGAISQLYPDAIGGISDDSFSFGVFRKMQTALKGFNVSCKNIWPYLVTKRCKGDIFGKIREKMSQDDALNLASFLGVQLRLLHQLPLPPVKNKTHFDMNQIHFNKRTREFNTEECRDIFVENSDIPSEWNLFADSLHASKRNVRRRLEQWGDPIPAALIEKAEEYLPYDVTHLLDIVKDDHGLSTSSGPSWIHSDIMDDNILLEPASTSSSSKRAPEDGPVKNGLNSLSNGIGGNQKWIPTHIIDFSDLSIGDPLLDIIPMYLDVLRGDTPLLKKFLESYALPFSKIKDRYAPTNGRLEESKLNRVSYRAMCYCILHDDNVLGAIFSLWDELKAAVSWEAIEETVWGELNYYQQSLSNKPN
ncbi:F-box protein [Carex littledalei]|uniref:F-box protein n=1 Tax=Carex littledalei TaxID=544730 RepID=A0A833V2C1_9POAL|nr:F-box protein [Carex littledalei]